MAILIRLEGHDDTLLDITDLDKHIGREITIKLWSEPEQCTVDGEQRRSFSIRYTGRLERYDYPTDKPGREYTVHCSGSDMGLSLCVYNRPKGLTTEFHIDIVEML
jgi:hypothetical protein